MPAVARPLERAQLVWQRAVELSDPAVHHDPFALALDLLRVAHHDPDTMAHALTLGARKVQADAGDAAAVGATRVLRAAIAFLGLKP
jgi:hypothetical protein